MQINYGHNTDPGDNDAKHDFAQSGRGTRNAKKTLKGFQGCDKNGPNESFKMRPHLIGLD